MAESEGPDIQVAPEGVNMVVGQQGDVDVLPSVSVTMSQDGTSNQEPPETIISGQIRELQVGEENIIYRRDESTEGGAFISLHGTRSPVEITTNDNLHYIIESPDGGVIQIGKCCILLRVNFSNSLVCRLLDEGDVNVRLQSNDVLLQLQWSNWDVKKETIRSRIKIEIKTAWEEEKQAIENEVIKSLISSSLNYFQLRMMVNGIYNRFGAMLQQVTGGCIELWVVNDSRQQLNEMRSRKQELQKILRSALHTVNRTRDFELSVTFLDGFPEAGMEVKLSEGTPVRSDVRQTTLKRPTNEPVSRSEMEEFVSRTVSKAIKTDRETRALMTLEREELRELLWRQRPEPRERIYSIGKKELLGIVWKRMMGSWDIQYSKSKKEGTMSVSREELIMSLLKNVLTDLEHILPETQVINVVRFEMDVSNSLYVMMQTVFREIDKISFSKDGYITEGEISDFKTRIGLNMFSTMIAGYSKQIPPSEHSPQGSERLIKEPGETEKLLSEIKGEAPVIADPEAMKLQKEQMLQQATANEKNFLKTELDFYEINENPNSPLPLGTRVEPSSTKKRALLQASIQKNVAEASALSETSVETFGTVVNHPVEDDELILVHWDNPDESFLYHESNVKAMVRQKPRRIFEVEQVKVGVYVEKGDNWAFEDQAGPMGIGTVIRHDTESGLVQVKWHGGVAGWNSYRIGQDVETRKDCFVDGEDQSTSQ